MQAITLKGFKMQMGTLEVKVQAPYLLLTETFDPRKSEEFYHEAVTGKKTEATWRWTPHLEIVRCLLKCSQ